MWLCIWGVGMSGARLHMYVHACAHGYVCFNAGSDSVYRPSLGLGGQERPSWTRGAAQHRGLVLKGLGASGVGPRPRRCVCESDRCCSLASLRRIKSVNAT